MNAIDILHGAGFSPAYGTITSTAEHYAARTLTDEGAGASMLVRAVANLDRDAPPPVRVSVENGDANTLRTVARNGQPVGTVRERPGIGVRAGESVWEARKGFRKNAIELGTFRTMEEAAEAVAR